LVQPATATGATSGDAFAITRSRTSRPADEDHQYALQLAEESTSIPLITQGQSGDTQPETLGATNIQNNNANQLLRSIGYAFDDHITEPVVRQFYEWLLLDPDVPDDEKGEFTINAHGSVALVEQAIQDQTIAQMGRWSKDPAYGIDPKKWIKLFLKSKRLDPESIQYTAEQQAKIDAQPPPDPPSRRRRQRSPRRPPRRRSPPSRPRTSRASASEERIAQAAAVLEGGRVQAENSRTVVNHIERLHELSDRARTGAAQIREPMHQMKLEDVKAHSPRPR
jgi:hypothetical protein